MECVWIHLIEKGINYYIMIVHTLAWNHIYKNHESNTYRTFNLQIVAYIRYYMEEKLHTKYISEYNRHEYSTYVTFVVTSNNLMFIVPDSS